MSARREVARARAERVVIGSNLTVSPTRPRDSGVPNTETLALLIKNRASNRSRSTFWATARPGQRRCRVPWRAGVPQHRDVPPGLKDKGPQPHPAL